MDFSENIDNFKKLNNNEKYETSNLNVYKIVTPSNNETNSTITNIGPNVSSQLNELRIAERTPIIELKSVYGLSSLRDNVTTTGFGTVSNTTFEYQVSTTTGELDSAKLESVERGRYMPGFAGQVGIGVRVPNAPTHNQIFRWGLFDDKNGAYFGQNANGVFVGIRRAGIDTIIQQNDWNIDRLDGSGSSGETLNLSHGNIFQITFTWYGYGVIQFDVVLQDHITMAQKVVSVHRYKPIAETSFTDPNLPIGVEIENNGLTTGDRSILVGGRQYNIIGKFRPEFRITSDRRDVTVGSGGLPVLSFKRKTIFPVGSNRPNSVSLKLEGLDIVTGSDIYYKIVVGGTLNGSFTNFPTTNTAIPDSETALLVNNSATTITGGQVIYQGVAAGIQGTARDLATASLLKFEFPGEEPVTLVIGAIGNNSVVSAVLRITEEW